MQWFYFELPSLDRFINGVDSKVHLVNRNPKDNFTLSNLISDLDTEKLWQRTNHHEKEKKKIQSLMLLMHLNLHNSRSLYQSIKESNLWVCLSSKSFKYYTQRPQNRAERVERREYIWIESRNILYSFHYWSLLFHYYRP